MMSLTLIKVVECEQIPLKTFLNTEKGHNLTITNSDRVSVVEEPTSPTLTIKLLLKEAILT